MRNIKTQRRCVACVCVYVRALPHLPFHVNHGQGRRATRCCAPREMGATARPPVFSGIMKLAWRLRAVASRRGAHQRNFNLRFFFFFLLQQSWLLLLLQSAKISSSSFLLFVCFYARSLLCNSTTGILISTFFFDFFTFHFASSTTSCRCVSFSLHSYATH